jgi:hypothetical protein
MVEDRAGMKMSWVANGRLRLNCAAFYEAHQPQSSLNSQKPLFLRLNCQEGHLGYFKSSQQAKRVAT